MGKKIRALALAAGATALIAVPVAPAAADEGPCQFLMPIEPGDVVECVRYILVSAINWPPR